jgi:lysophospholipase L1-like esterase
MFEYETNCQTRSFLHNNVIKGAMRQFPTNTGLTLAWFLTLAAAWQIVPRLVPSSTETTAEAATFRNMADNVLTSTARRSSPSAMPSMASAAAVPTGYQPAERVDESDLRLEDPSGRALTFFYESLAQTDAGQDDHLTRIVHFGDSMLTGDAVSGAVRSALQNRFGDGGHGFVLAGRPWPWYRHRGVITWNSEFFRVNRITANPLRDGRLGLGGVAFRAMRPGARLYVQAKDENPTSKFELFYLAHPRGGDLDVEIPGVFSQRISTANPVATSQFLRVNVPEGKHRLTVTHVGGGETRVFGTALERQGPGVVYDSLGINGLRAVHFERFDGPHLTEQIRHRSPALIMLMLGTNESQFLGQDVSRHGDALAAMLDRLREGAEHASCLIVSPPDRGVREEGRRARSWSNIGAIVEHQQEIALANGCAFWNTYQAMGGAGSALAWRRARPPLMGGDYTHPTRAGAERLGQSLAQAIVSGYEQFQRRQAASRQAAAPAQNPPQQDSRLN